MFEINSFTASPAKGSEAWHGKYICLHGSRGDSTGAWLEQAMCLQAAGPGANGMGLKIKAGLSKLGLSAETTTEATYKDCRILQEESLRLRRTGGVCWRCCGVIVGMCAQSTRLSGLPGHRVVQTFVR